MLKRESSARTGQIVARSLGISKSTHTVILAVAAAVALNAMVAIQFLSIIGQAVLLAVIFVSIAFGASAISADVYSRSSQTVSNLRSIGANSGSLSAALVSSTLAYGAGGSVLGACIGAALGVGVGNPGGLGSNLIVETVWVIIASCAAIVAGVYAGTKSVWRS